MLHKEIPLPIGCSVAKAKLSDGFSMIAIIEELLAESEYETTRKLVDAA